MQKISLNMISCINSDERWYRIKILNFFIFKWLVERIEKKSVVQYLVLSAVCVVERKQRAETGSQTGTPKKNVIVGGIGGSSPQSKSPSPAPVHSYGKLVMCKRFCQRVGDLADDPVELRLLYFQAVHYVVHVSRACIGNLAVSCKRQLAVNLSGARNTAEFVCSLIACYRFRWITIELETFDSVVPSHRNHTELKSTRIELPDRISFKRVEWRPYQFTAQSALWSPNCNR